VLSQSDVDRVAVMKELATRGLEAGYLVPTTTGMGKSIMDAHHSLREFLRVRGIHDFSLQSQGTQGRVVLPVSILTPTGMISGKMSLYRPKSKQGDPRIWIYGLPEFAAAGNLLVLLEHEKHLFIANASFPAVFESRNKPGSPLYELLRSASIEADAIAEELTALLRGIGQRGFVPSLRSGDTGVGYTLETLLGIKANSRRAPDYKGIELKSARLGSPSRSASLSSLFALAPNWQLSHLKSTFEILQTHGYVSKKGRLQLYQTVRSRANRKGFFLETAEQARLLHTRRVIEQAVHPVVTWQFADLTAALAAKHRRTFWVKARSRADGLGREEFHYVEALKTEAPLVSNLPTLIEADVVTCDFTIYAEPTGGAGDHGYLFRIPPRRLDLLFPPSVRIDLT